MLGIYDGTENLEEQRKKLGIKNTGQGTNFLQNIQGPGAQEFSNALNKTKEAYQEGGFSSALGVGVRNTPGVIAATIRDTITPEPLRRGLSALAGEGKEVTKAVVSGKATPTEQEPKTWADNVARASKPLTRGSVEDHGKTTNMQEGALIDPVIAPKINEPVNALRDAELGKMTSSAKRLPDGSQRNTLSIGGNTLSYNPADFNRGDNNIIESANKPIRGLQQLGNGLDITFDKSIPQNIRQAVVANSSGEMSPEETQRRNLARQQFLDRQGYKEADPYEGLNTRAKRELMIQKEQNKQSSLNNQADNAVQAERNRILEKSNLLEDERLKMPKEVKPDSQVLDFTDNIGNKRQEIWANDGSGKYVRAMADQQTVESPTIATIEKMKSLRGDPKAEAQYKARFGQLPY